MVRKGIKLGLKAVVEDNVERMFAAYAHSVLRLGTPVFPKKYFALLQQTFGDECEVRTILTEDGRLVASVLSFYWRDEVVPYYGGGTDLAREVAGNDFMYWSLMQAAAARGCRIFDFGRSKLGTGAYDFKKNWGFTAEPLPYELHAAGARPAVCLGTDPVHTGGALLDAAVRSFAGCGTVAVNTPFAGCYVPLKHFRRYAEVSAVMVEIRRDTYLSAALAPTAGLVRVAAALAGLVDAVTGAGCGNGPVGAS
jgi:hypothetical protein